MTYPAQTFVVACVGRAPFRFATDCCLPSFPADNLKRLHRASFSIISPTCAAVSFVSLSPMVWAQLQIAIGLPVIAFHLTQVVGARWWILCEYELFVSTNGITGSDIFSKHVCLRVLDIAVSCDWMKSREDVYDGKRRHVNHLFILANLYGAPQEAYSEALLVQPRSVLWSVLGRL